MSNTVSAFINLIKRNIENLDVSEEVSEVGTLISLGDGIAKICGLESITMSELVQFENGTKGIVLNLNHDSVDVIILGSEKDLYEGISVKRLKKNACVPVGMEMLGRVVDSLGRPIDGKGPIKADDYNEIESPAPSIMDRKSIHESLETGIKVIDAMLPIGRGQRELIIGDRQTGKTAIAIDTIINQGNLNKKKSYRNEKVFSIYVAIGQKNSTIANIINELESRGIMQDCIIVVASAADPVSMQYLAPYTGCAIGEYFRDNGMHALIVYDDLTKHAIAYRQISLLLRRPPAREAYPGDVFYLHSRLLERAAKMSDNHGAGSLTALPIIETQAGDISAYIPTNVISITDGQIFLENELFLKGIRPAINIGLSVSRVGSAAQIKAMKQVSGQLKSDLAQYMELETFSKFGSDLDDNTIALLDSGRKIRYLLTQPQFSPVPVEEQIIILFISNKNFLKEIPLNVVDNFISEFIRHIHATHTDILNMIRNTKFLSEETSEKISNIVEDFIQNFKQSYNIGV